MNLLPNEQTLVTSNGNKIILTNQRIQLTQKEWGYYYKMVLFLEKISSIEVRITSQIILLILSGAALITGIYLFGMYQNFMNAGIIAAIILFVGWLATRKRVVSICTDSGNRMNISVNELSQEDIDSFINNLQAAQQDRLSTITA